MPIQTINPATSEPLKIYTPMLNNEVDKIIDATHQAFLRWRAESMAMRSAKLRDVATALLQEKTEFSQLMTSEMGKPIAEAEAEIEKCAQVCKFYADNAEAFLADEPLNHDTLDSFVSFEPLGVVLAVMPWNFPFWQVFRFAAPTLAAGNTCVLKHASNVSGCALAIERVFQNADLPENAFSTLLVESGEMEKVIKNKYIRAVTLTGSTAAGRAVAATAANQLKKSVLELGGSDPYIVLRDADIKHAAKICAKSRLINAGQSCISAKRFVVEHEVLDLFEKALVEEMQTYTMGDPSQHETQIGPMASVEFRDEIHEQVQKTLESGAELLLGGNIPEGTGAYYPPTVLTQVSSGSPAYADEIFGPVAAIIPADDEDAAIEIANDSTFGLGAAIFSRDIDKARQLARRVQAGNCFINDFVRSAPELPFGGIKDSGYGRELSHYGIKEFVNCKTIAIKKS